MIIKWPRVITSAAVSEEPVISTDFYPTLMEMAGLPKNTVQHRDGVSLMKLLKGKKKLNRNAIYWHYPHYGNQGRSPGSAIRQGTGN
jgi:arylsulfatase A-like enzyme